VTKIAQVGREGEDLLEKITRYTKQSECGQREDFLALTSDSERGLSRWNKNTAFLGNPTSSVGFAPRAPEATTRHQTIQGMCNAFDLIKVYGSGWLGEAGTA